MKKFLLVFFWLAVFQSGIFYASERIQPETKMLVDVIQAQASPSVTEHLQKRIDETFLPGYQVEGKPVLEIFTGYNLRSTDKSLEACLQYSADEDRAYMIFDNGTYYALRDYSGQNLSYQKNFEQWKILYEMIENADTSMELCGKERLVTGITCFDTVEDGLVIYFQTTEGIFIRHYARGYSFSYDNIYDRKLVPMDYSLSEFIHYTNQYTNWMKRESENYRIQGIKVTGRQSFSGYMNDGAATPAPLLKSQKSFSMYIWIPLAGAVVVAGGVLGVMFYRRKRRCAS